MIARFYTTQATTEQPCAKCGQPAGQHCRTPKGRRSTTTHSERVWAYQDAIGAEEFRRRHSVEPSPLDLSRIGSIVVFPPQ